MLAKTGPLKQVLAAMGINHTVMNPGWVVKISVILRSLLFVFIFEYGK